MENPIKMDDLGGTTIFGNIHIDPMNFPAIHGSVHILYRDPHRLQDLPIKPFKGWGRSTRKVTTNHLSHEKKNGRILSMKYWFFNRNPCNGL